MIKTISSRSQQPTSGFVLPLVIVVGFILVIGGMTLVARSFSGLIGSVRQQKSRQARETAEIGLAVSMEALNGRYGYLMINCYPNPVDSSGNATGPYFDFTDAATPIQNSCLYTGGWGSDTPANTTDASPEFPSSLCPGSSSGTPILSDTLTNPNTRYRIDYYAFNGTEFYGGKGTLQVTGEVLNQDNKIVATSTIRQTFNVITEPCGGFPGLLMIHDGDLGNNDILGLQSGNVHCVGCTVDSAPDDQGLYTREQLEDAVGAGNRSEITGNITIGPLSFPPVPQFPSHDANCREINGQAQDCYSLADHNAARVSSQLNGVTIEAITIGSLPNDHDHDNSGYIITAGSTTGPLNVAEGADGNYLNKTNTDEQIKDFCVVLPEGDQQITHCLIDEINLSGTQTLRIDSSNGPVRLYFKGKTVNASGKGGIEHVWDQGGSPPASRLGLFGIRTDEEDIDGKKLCTSNLGDLDIPPPSGTLIQEVKLSGGGGFSHLFGYFPCGITGINGGSGGETVNGVCTEPGDMNGAIWTAYWGFSNSNVAELCVPDNMVDQLRYFFGSEFALSVRRYRAQGISEWRGFQGLSQ